MNMAHQANRPNNSLQSTLLSGEASRTRIALTGPLIRVGEPYSTAVKIWPLWQTSAEREINLDADLLTEIKILKAKRWKMPP